ncbi:hypothetical protein J6590_045417 [Homalodisca vitripennis]|nr:hypothetical protein J6590_100026 [Homalodisca vitripennis]KAG8331226.1 hypothetical protein J6590_045417 [Homalodisca vitripennis]
MQISQLILVKCSESVSFYIFLATAELIASNLKVIQTEIYYIMKNSTTVIVLTKHSPLIKLLCLLFTMNDLKGSWMMDICCFFIWKLVSAMFLKEVLLQGIFLVNERLLLKPKLTKDELRAVSFGKIMQSKCYHWTEILKGYQDYSD